MKTRHLLQHTFTTVASAVVCNVSSHRLTGRSLPSALRTRRTGSPRSGFRITTQHLLVASLISLCVGLIAGCGRGHRATSSGPEINLPPPQYIINPADTDAAIDPSFGNHYVYINHAVSPKGKLFAFLSATGTNPGDYKLVLQTAADNGFHAIGLAYDNSTTVQGLCSGSADPNCHGDIRGEILTGQDLSPLVSVDRANSVDNRLTKALLYLAQQHPQDGWAEYLDANNNLRWNLIHVAGHSQGGGEAAYIAKQRQVGRACFLSSPGDFDDLQNKVAAWELAPGITPVDRYFGFFHQRDGVIPADIIGQVWPALQMDTFGTYVNVDTVAAPYGGSHMLTTNLDKPSYVTGDDGSAFHKITAMDLFTPIDSNGLPVYRAAWQYLCFN